MTLSDKIEIAKFRLGTGYALHKNDVKESIKELKKEIESEAGEDGLGSAYIFSIIDKLSGDKLI